MRILTLQRREFEEMCRQLQKMVSESGYDYDILVAIARGGVYVADEFDCRYKYSVKAQRKSTRRKKGIVGAMIKRLPQGINKLLRYAEAIVLELRDLVCRVRPVEPEIGLELRARLKDGRTHRILIADDAVDSGASMQGVLTALRELSPESEIRTAAVTQTRSKPVVRPDYALFRDRTLIRFPWAMDMAR